MYGKDCRPLINIADELRNVSVGCILAILFCNQGKEGVLLLNVKTLKFFMDTS